MSTRGGSLYDVLGVAPGAEEVVVEAAYRALIKKYHPDQAGASDAGRTAAEVNAAYAVLKDPGRRAEYDQRLWLRDQGAILQTAQPPAPAFNLAAWSGWTVSLLLGATVVAMAAGKLAPPPNAIPVPAQPEVATGAPSAESAAENFWSRAHLATGLVSTPPAEAATLPPPPAPAAIVPVPAEAKPQRPLAARAARTKQQAQPRTTRARAQSEDQQFREREGYIY